MTLRKIAILALALLLPLTTIEAQKKKKRVIKRPVVVVEEPQEDPRITNMREMTQQIIIIDSIVTDKKQFLSVIRLSSETGRLTTTSQFFGNKASGFAFLNEMGNKVYFSQPSANGQHLYTSDKLGNKWSEPALLKGLDDGITEADYPFMMNDGVTFYFAAQGEESIGGYDIFFTRYDSHNGHFLKPENIGMPFNSEANDYMYAVDEQNKIGYFVSDRRQPEDKVCVYIFIPTETRKTYDPAVYSEERIRSFADITRIADTWGNGSERNAAIERMTRIGIQQPPTPPISSSKSQILINDALTYSSARSFRSSKAASLYEQLVKTRQQQETLDSELDKMRIRYAKGNDAERRLLKEPILHNEQQSLQLAQTIKSLEKQVRNEENKVINQ